MAPPDAMTGVSPAMRKMLRRSMSPGTDRGSRVRELDPELQAELAAKRAMRRKVQELWSKQPHGYTQEDLTSVRSIHFGYCHLADDDAVALASQLSKEMRQLTSLQLYGNRIHNPGMIALSNAFTSGAVPFLVELSLGHNAIGDEGLQALMEVFAPKGMVEDGKLPRLEQLGLDHNRIGADGVAAIAQAAEKGAFANLRTLSLSGNTRIGDEGLSALAKACNNDEDVLANLSELHLREIGATADGGITQLANAMMPTQRGLTALRLLVIDEEFIDSGRIKEMTTGRTGHGGVHAVKVQAYGDWSRSGTRKGVMVARESEVH